MARTGAERVGLRRLTRHEQRVLGRKLRELRLPARLHRRYQIVRAAQRAPSVPAAARQVGCDITTAYHWVARFNASGFTTFERPTNPRGRIPLITSEQLRELMDVALSSPRERGLLFSIWTVPKLAAYCRECDLIPPYCDEWVRRLLRGAGMMICSGDLPPDVVPVSMLVHPSQCRHYRPRWTHLVASKGGLT